MISENPMTNDSKRSASTKWMVELVKFLDTQPDDVVLDSSHIKTIVSHTFVYNGQIPPAEEVLDQFLKEYLEHKFGKTEVKHFYNGVLSSYTGQVKEGTNIRHGLGRQSQSDGLFYEGYFKDDKFHGFGYGEGPAGSDIVKCGLWGNDQLVKQLRPEYIALKSTRKKVKALLDEYWVKVRKEEDKEESAWLYDADPNCEHVIVSGDNYSGIKCKKCRGWFCY